MSYEMEGNDRTTFDSKECTSWNTMIWLMWNYISNLWFSYRLCAAFIESSHFQRMAFVVYSRWMARAKVRGRVCPRLPSRKVCGIQQIVHVLVLSRVSSHENVMGVYMCPAWQSLKSDQKRTTAGAVLQYLVPNTFHHLDPATERFALILHAGEPSLESAPSMLVKDDAQSGSACKKHV